MVVNLVAFLVRPKEHLSNHVAPPSHVQEAVSDFKAFLEVDDNASGTEEALFTLLVVIWTHHWPSASNGNIYDPTMQYLATSHLKKDGSWKMLSGVSAGIAQFTYMMRLTCAYKIWRESNVAFATPVGTQEAATKRMEAQFQAYEKNSGWIHETHPCTFRVLRSLQHLVSHIVMSTPQAPNIHWLDELRRMELKAEGETITLEELRLSMREMTEKALKTYEELLFYDTSVRVDYEEIHDVLSDTSFGYWFGEDPRNPQFHDRELLLKRIVNDPVLSSNFVLSYDSDGEPIWNMLHVDKWLDLYALLQLLEFINDLFANGGAPRCSELAISTFRNTTGMNQRSLVAYRKAILNIGRYMKQSGLTNQDKLICRPLNAVFADLRVQDLVVLRPLAELFASLKFPGNEEIRLLYHNSVFVDYSRPFTPRVVTPKLKEYVCKHSMCKAGVALLRQVGNALRRHWTHVPEDEVDDGDEDDEDDVHPNVYSMGHSTRMDINNYSISTSALLRCPEEYMDPMLEHGVLWHKALALVPGKFPSAPCPKGLHSRIVRSSSAGTWMNCLDYRTMPAIEAPSAPPTQRPPFEIDLGVLSEKLIGCMLPHLNQLPPPSVDYDLVAENVKEKLLPHIHVPRPSTPVLPGPDIDLLAAKVGERIVPDLLKAFKELLSSNGGFSSSTNPASGSDRQRAKGDRAAFTRQTTLGASTLGEEGSTDVSMGGKQSHLRRPCTQLIVSLSVPTPGYNAGGGSGSFSNLSKAMDDDADMPPPSSEEGTQPSRQGAQSISYSRRALSAHAYLTQSKSLQPRRCLPSTRERTPVSDLSVSTSMPIPSLTLYFCFVLFYVCARQIVDATSIDVGRSRPESASSER